MHTEEAAKLLYCPMARVKTEYLISQSRGIALTAINRWDSDCGFSKCLASKCGMWRWTRDIKKWERSTDPERTRFCGLAAMPLGRD